MPGAALRMYPARTSSLWLGTSASAGSSRRVRRNRDDIRNNTVNLLWSSVQATGAPPPPALAFPPRPSRAAPPAADVTSAMVGRHAERHALSGEHGRSQVREA